MVVGERLEGGVAAPRLVEVRVLGCFSVALVGRALRRTDWQRLSAERLFKLLLVTHGHRISRELAAETLWPESPADMGRTNLRKAIHFAHRALHGSDVLVGDSHMIALDVEQLDLDLDRLTRALDILHKRARIATPGGRPVSREGANVDMARATGAADDAAERAVATALETVLELGALELLPEDQYEDWLVGPRERLRSQWLRTAIQVAREARAVGRPDRAHEIVDQLLELDATDEAAHRLAIELYAAEGRHHAVRRQFELCRSALRTVLDAEPGTETVEAYRAAEARAAQRTVDSGLGAANARAGLVARRHELEQIEPLFDRVADGRLACLVMRGAAGIGKTRLLEEVSAYGRSAGWQIVAWQAVEALRVEAFAPLRIALASRLTPDEVATWSEPARSGIATLIPSLDGGHLEFQDRASLVAALVAAVGELARRGPVVLTIDDVPWLDESSIAFLAALVASSASTPLLVAGTYRDDEPASDAVHALVEQMHRAGGLDIWLSPLARRDVDALVTGHMGGKTVDPELGRMVFEQSRGNPLFCLEIVRAAIEHGEVRQRDGRWELTPRAMLAELPDSARRVAARRSAALPGSARELLAIAAELGSEIPFAVLAAALPGGGGRAIEALDAALASGLLVEAGTGYAFAHPLYRLAVRSSAGPARRAATQFAIARALAGESLGDQAAEELEPAARASSDPTAVADHALTAAELGVRDAVPLAIAFGFAAGRRLFDLHDRSGAAAILERALAIWRRLPEADGRTYAASQAFIDLARLVDAAGDTPRAIALFREAIAAARNPEEIALAYDSFWEWIPYRRGDFAGGRVLLDEALARMPESAAPQRAHMEALLGWTLVRMRQPAAALPLLEHAARLLGPSIDALRAMRVLDSLGMTLHYLGRGDEGRVYVERSLAISLERHNCFGEILGNLHVGVLLSRGGQQARARPMFARAAELGRLTGNAYVEGLAEWGGAEASDELGDYEAARRSRLREIELYDSIGGNPHNAAMAHAHLANLARRLGDTVELEREASEARRLALLSAEPGYLERIERAITIERWAELET